MTGELLSSLLDDGDLGGWHSVGERKDALVFLKAVFDFEDCFCWGRGEDVEAF